MKKASSLLILHISDIHFRKGESIHEPKHIVAALRSITDPHGCCIIAVSGDVAYSGKAEEYDLAQSFFSSLKEQVTQEWKYPVHFLSVPGNHDCAFSEKDGMRKFTLAALDKMFDQVFESEPFKKILEPQENYRKWQTAMEEKNISHFEDSLKRSIRISLPGESPKTVAFSLYNTAWMSEQSERKGQLRFKNDLIVQAEGDNDLVVSMFHHPYSWLSDSDSREFRRRVEQTSDIILSGHEHDGETYTKDNGQLQKTEYIEGAAYNAHSVDAASGFHAILLDLDREQKQCHSFFWDGNHYTNGGQEIEWTEFVRKKNLMKNKFRPNSEYEQRLSDPGMNLTHSKKILTLDDIFIPPAVSILLDTSTGKSLNGKTIKSDDFFEETNTKQLVRFSGTTQSGKTAVARMLYKHCIAKGVVPVMLDGEKLTSTKHDTLQRGVLKRFIEQYDKGLEEDYLQLPKKNRAIIVDKFARNKLAPRAKSQLEDWFAEFADYVYIFGDDFNEIEELLIAPDAHKSNRGYTYCQLKPFGYALRHRLIEKWLLIGREDFLTKEKLSHEVKKVESFVNTLLGKDVIPSYPVYLLIILQQAENQDHIDTSIASSGYFFDILIKSELEKQRGTIDTDTRMNYLAELSWLIVQNDSSVLSEEAFKSFHDWYCKEHIVDIDKGLTLNEMKQSKILREESDGYSFYYRYLRYYYVSFYMSRKLDADDVRVYLDKLITEIHLEDSANTLIYLSYHSRDKYIIEKLLDRANSILKSYPTCDLEQQVEYINRLQAELPEFSLPETDVDTRRLAHLDTQDVLEDSLSGIEEPMTEEEEKSLEDYMQINSAFKTMQVLGQIARNYAGTMSGKEKKILVDACFRLGFRSMGMMYELFERSLDSVVEAIGRLMKNKLESAREDEVDKLVKSIFFMLSELLAFGLMKRISHSIGSENLVPVFDVVCKEGGELSYRLVDLSIRLDHTNKFPEQKVLSMNKEQNENLFGKTLLTMLVREHFYMFHVDYAVRQRVCEKLGIKLPQGKVLLKNQKKLPPNSRG